MRKNIKKISLLSLFMCAFMLCICLFVWNKQEVYAQSSSETVVYEDLVDGGWISRNPWTPQNNFTSNLSITLEAGSTGAYYENGFGAFQYGKNYNGGDFAVKFISNPGEVSGGIIIRVDQFVVWITNTDLKIGYGEFDTIYLYSPALWTDDIGVSPLGESAWLETKTISVLYTNEIYFNISTKNDTTTIQVSVAGNELTATTDRARITNKPFIMSGGSGTPTIWNFKLNDYLQKLNAISTSDLEASVKTSVEKAKSDALTGLTARKTTSFADADLLLAKPKSILLTNTAKQYLNDSVDISDDSFIKDGEGWSNNANSNNDITTNWFAELPVYSWSTYVENGATGNNALSWKGGKNGLYNKNGDFSVKFLAEITADGFVVKVDQFCIWVSSSKMSISYNETDYTAQGLYHRAFWFQDAVTLGAIDSKVVTLSGLTEVGVIVKTTTDGTTLIAVKAGDDMLSVLAVRERKFDNNCLILSGFDSFKIFSTKVGEYRNKTENIKNEIDSTFYSQNKQEIDSFIQEKNSLYISGMNLSESICNSIFEETIAIVNKYKAALDKFDAYIEQDYDQTEWNSIKRYKAEIKAEYLNNSLEECVNLDQTITDVLNSIASKEKKQMLITLKNSAKQSIEEYANSINYSNYDSSAITKISSLVENKLLEIDNESDERQIGLYLDVVESMVNAIRTISQNKEFYNSKIEDSVNLLNASDYSENNWNLIQSYKTTAQGQIQTCSSESEMVAVIDSFNSQLTSVKKIDDDTPQNKPDNNGEENNSGCASSVNGGAISLGLLLLACGSTVFVLTSKKRKNNKI